MNKKVEEVRKSNSIELFGTILPFLPTLLLKSGWAFLRFKMEAKRGGDIFQKELINQGLDKTTASRITGIYLEGSNVFQLLVKMS
jgi:hypothetical protein